GAAAAAPAPGHAVGGWGGARGVKASSCAPPIAANSSFSPPLPLTDPCQFDIVPCIPWAGCTEAAQFHHAGAAAWPIAARVQQQHCISILHRGVPKSHAAFRHAQERTAG